MKMKKLRFDPLKKLRKSDAELVFKIPLLFADIQDKKWKFKIRKLAGSKR